jgi:hypothetical protein
LCVSRDYTDTEHCIKILLKGWLAALERNVVRRMFGGIKANENWRKRHNKALMKLFGDLDILLFVTVSLLDWLW